MFDLDQFIADYRTAAVAGRSHKSARAIVAHAVCDRDGIFIGIHRE